MTRQITIIFLLLFSLCVFGQTYSKKELKYHPKTFEEALTQLDKGFSDSTKTKIKTMSESEFVGTTHLGTGMWIRNDWLYDRNFFRLIVTESPLRKELAAKGLPTNDDMSLFLLRSYYRKLTGQDLATEQQIKDVHQYYSNMNNPEWRKQQAEIYWTNLMQQFNIGDTLVRHIYYKRNWLGDPKQNTIIKCVVIEKKEHQLKLNVVNFGGEAEKNLVFEEINCKEGDCWVDAHNWKQYK
jgi:hypothetical protein